MKKKKTYSPVKHKYAKVNDSQGKNYKRITISSLQEMEMKMQQNTANMTPGQRMQYLQRLIRITHGDDFSEQEKIFQEGRIKIIKSEEELKKINRYKNK